MRGYPYRRFRLLVFWITTIPLVALAVAGFLFCLLVAIDVFRFTLYYFL